MNSKIQSEKTKNRKMKIGQNLRINLFDESGNYVTQVLLSTDKYSEKKLSIYYFSDCAFIKDCS